MQSSEFICGTHKGSSHTKTHTHTHRHTHRHTQTHTRTQLHSHTDTDTHAHKHTHSRTHKAIHTCRLSTALVSITPPTCIHTRHPHRHTHISRCVRTLPNCCIGPPDNTSHSATCPSLVWTRMFRRLFSTCGDTHHDRLECRRYTHTHTHTHTHTQQD
jgi:hypothetical protein